jgi:HlyD family secretion protein
MVDYPWSGLFVAENRSVKAMKMGLRGLIPVFAFVCLMIAVGGCSMSGNDQVVEDQEYVTVERGSIESSISAVGSVRARNEVLLSFETAGRVSNVLVEAGEAVEQDQVLAQLNMEDLELQVRSAEAVLAVSSAQLDQLDAGPRPEEVAAAEGQVEAMLAALAQATAQRDQLLAGATEAEIAAARAAVNSAQANYARVKAGPSAEEVAAVQATLDGAKAAKEQAQAAYDRVKDRADVQMLPESLAMRNATIEMERAQANYNALVNHPTEAELAAAAAQVAQSEAQLAQLLTGQEPQVRVADAAVSAAEAQRDIAQAQLELLLAGATQEQIAAAEAQVEQARVALDSALLAMERAILRAPIDGVVAQVEVEVGESVGPQTPVMTLTGGSQFRIEADVDEADVGWMAIGQEVAIDFDAFPGQILQGRVVAIAPLASEDIGVVSYRVTIEGEPTDLPLRGGMTANTEIVKDRSLDVLLVPNLAISIDPESGRKIVTRQTATGAEQVEIATGLSTDFYSEVAAGLEEGDVVIITSPSAREQFREMMGSSFMGGDSE